MKTTKIFLEFQQVEFNNAKTLFAKKQIVKNQMYAELSKLIDEAVDPADCIESNPLDFYYNWLLEKYKDRNQMNLKAIKLVDLLEIDLTSFNSSIAKNNAVLNVPEPIEEEFKVYAETPEELARLKLATDLIDVAERFNKMNGSVQSVNLTVFKPIIIYDGSVLKYVPHPAWIKSTIYKNIL